MGWEGEDTKEAHQNRSSALDKFVNSSAVFSQNIPTLKDVCLRIKRPVNYGCTVVPRLPREEHISVTATAREEDHRNAARNAQQSWGFGAVADAETYSSLSPSPSH